MKQIKPTPDRAADTARDERHAKAARTPVRELTDEEMRAIGAGSSMMKPAAADGTDRSNMV